VPRVRGGRKKTVFFCFFPSVFFVFSHKIKNRKKTEKLEKLTLRAPKRKIWLLHAKTAAQIINGPVLLILSLFFQLFRIIEALLSI